MKTLSNMTASLSIEFPRTWNPPDLSAVSVQIADFEGNALPVNGEDPPAAASAALYPMAALSLDSRRYSRDITLAEGAEDLVVGDLIRIWGIQGHEDHVVKGWDAANLQAKLENAVDRDFESGAVVYRLSAIAAVDFSDTDTFPAGLQMVITWTPTGTGSSITELAEIETVVQVDIADFTSKFRASYKRAYAALTSPENTLDTVIEMAKEELRGDLGDAGFDISRIMDQRLLTPPLMAQAALIWARDGDENTADEMAVYERVYSAALKKLCNRPVWVDLNGDGKKDDTEEQSHPVYFERKW